MAKVTNTHAASREYVYLVDEADEVFEESLCMLNKQRNKYVGLATIPKKHIYCFSATMSDYWKGVLIKANLCRDEDIMYF